MQHEQLIKIYDNVLSIDLCNKIITYFEMQVDRKGPGVFAGGLLDPNIKNTIDFKIPTNIIETNLQWAGIDEELHAAFSPLLMKYIKDVNTTIPFIDIDKCFDTGYNIQKYIVNQGHYKHYHNDFALSTISYGYYRILTYIFYLNAVELGGETEFYGNYSIKPTPGRLVIFPASWTYPHCGKMPLSNDKYILTGWVYKEGMNTIQKIE